MNSYPTYILILRIHLVFEYVLISIFLFTIIKSKLWKRILLLIFPFFIAYIFFDFIKNANNYFGDIPTVIEFLIFIVFIIVYLFESMQLSIESPIYYSPIFWICVGLFVYFTGNFFYIVLVENSKEENNNVKNQLKIIYSSVSILKNIILGYALFNNEKSTINSKYPNDFPQDLDLDAITPNNKIT